MGCSSNSSIQEGNEHRKRAMKEEKIKIVDNSNLINGENEEQKVNNNINEDLIEDKKDDKKNIFKYKKPPNEDDKINVSPAEKEYIVEENNTEVNKNYKKIAYKGVTILENVKECLPENIDRNYIKDMVYNALGRNIVEDKSEYVKGRNLTSDQVEGIIDILYKIISENENVEKNEVEDERLNDCKVNIGFYEANEENIRKFIFKGKNPTEDDIQNALHQFNSGEEETKILAVEILD